MFPRINPTTTKAWKSLQAHASKMKEVKMKDLFASDKDRFSKYTRSIDDILIYFSKNIITGETTSLLFALANECKVKEAITAMFEGDLINETEHRAVLHTALR